jgi:hypothetical protein
MNNSGAIYIEHDDHAAVAAAVGRYLAGLGFAARPLPPHALSGRIMIAEKRRRHFFVLPAQNGWVTLWEDPRYFADRGLARHLAVVLAARAAWLEVSGNGVGWARGLYQGAETLEERYDEVVTTFYGEYGVLHFVYDIETTPEEWIAALGLPYDELHYEAVLEGELPAEAGEPIHLAFER